ncbi:MULTISPECIES: DUF418 domain-containing protein [unclassified Meiothermus]|uniref:DUF418 domain-containing protein n=1 Tax=unclassified Meiothermus TaxID=370471 RepID=UPI000D7C0B4A|nr:MULTISPECIES: DUF418 domain-containing protein [unclassified Meiothermus]PZA07825.1 DUF418 domain-containing protein [Meiothermus sp. Pnk-1]RYM38872.1 DUF418 domain-containing protein [Meiothermus sp. PNK-Is4]
MVTPARERDAFLDALRGFALFGILAVNLEAFADPFYSVAHSGEPMSDLGRAIITFFYSGKFYTIFATLFGLGLAWQASRLRARGLDPKPVLRRRLLWLLGAGAVHGTLLFSGDILGTYAVLGLFALRYHPAVATKAHHERSHLLRTGLAYYTVGIALLAGLSFWFGPGGVSPDAAIYAGGSFAEVSRARLWDWLWNTGSSIVLGFELVGLMLFGFYLFEHWQRFSAATLRRGILLGLVLGIPVNAYDVWVKPSYLEPLRGLGGLAFALVYACLIRLYWDRLCWLHLLQYAGRMPLTNYLMQSLVMSTVFYGYGLGLYGQVSPLLFPLIAAGFVALQVSFSRVWLERFPQGPVEWLWRKYTYAGVKPD